MGTGCNSRKTKLITRKQEGVKVKYASFHDLRSCLTGRFHGH